MVLSPQPRPSFVPHDGPDNPVFARIDPSDTIHATVLFAGALSEAQLDAAERAVLDWFADAEWGDALPELAHESLTRACLHVAVTRVASAREALAALLRALADARVPMRRAIFARLRADGDRDAVVRGMDPSARAQVRYDDAGAWWRACFDPAAAPPLSEDRAELAHDDDAILEVTGATFVERREMPLHVAGLRICYGLADAKFDDARLPRAARARDASRVLRAALDARFRGGDGSLVRPAPYDRFHRPDAPLDPIRAGERAGYSCAFRASDLREFLHDHLFRYGEHELMLAARDAAEVLDLEPVVCWRRFAGSYVMQLWERGATRVHVAA